MLKSRPASRTRRERASKSEKWLRRRKTSSQEMIKGPVSLQLRPTPQSETVSPGAPSCSPVPPRLRGSPRVPESPSGRQDGHRCVAAATPTSPRPAIRGRHPLCWIHGQELKTTADWCWESVCVWPLCVCVFRIKQRRRAPASTHWDTLWQGWFALLKPCWVPPRRLVLRQSKNFSPKSP